MKVLVIGGAGYIGSHTVKVLIDAKHDVVVFDDLSTGRREAVLKQATFAKGDVTNYDDLVKIFEQHHFDAILHFGAKIIVNESMHEPHNYFDSNINGVLNIIKAMRVFNVKNLIFSSTAAVYGITDKKLVNEHDIKNPINAYGASKLACEWIIEYSARAYNLNFVTFRYFNVAGATSEFKLGENKNNSPTHLIPIVIDVALQKRDQLDIFGNDYPTKDHTCVRDYIHVHDLARAHVLGLKLTSSNQSATINLGSGSGYTILEVIQAAENALKIKIPYQFKPRREGDPAQLVANNDLALKLLNFRPNFTLEEMIKSEYEWRKK